MTTIQKDTRLLMSDNKIIRVLNVMYDDKYKCDVVTFCGTLTYADAQSRGRAKLSQILEKIEAGTIKVVTTKLGDRLNPNSNWQHEVVDTVIQ